MFGVIKSLHENTYKTVVKYNCEGRFEYSTIYVLAFSESHLLEILNRDNSFYYIGSIVSSEIINPVEESIKNDDFRGYWFPDNKGKVQ